MPNPLVFLPRVFIFISRYHTSRRHLSKLNRLSLKCFKEVKLLLGVGCGTSRSLGELPQANRIGLNEYPLLPRTKIKDLNTIVCTSTCQPELSSGLSLGFHGEAFWKRWNSSFVKNKKHFR